MKCGNCGTLIKKYAHYCVKCNSKLNISPQPRAVPVDRLVMPISIGCALLGPPAYIISWSYWLSKNSKALNLIETGTHLDYKFYKSLSLTGIILYLSSFGLTGYLILSGRISDSVFTLFLAINFVLLAVWGLLGLISFLSTNAVIYRKLKFLIESHTGPAKDIKISYLPSILLGHMYFQFKFNDTARFIKYHHTALYEKPFFSKGVKTTYAVLILTSILVIFLSPAWTAFLSPVDARSASYAQMTNMTIHARQLFFSASPESVTSTALNETCHVSNSDSSSVEYGCYVPKANKIYLLNMQYTDFMDIEPTVAAHEMLHHAYIELTAAERARVDKLLGDNYRSLSISGNSAMQDLLAPYQNVSEATRINEMHSLFSVLPSSSLSPELNAYYSKYFSDNRYSLISAYESFVTIQTRKIDELKGLNNAIAAQQTNLNDFENALKNQKSSLDYYNYSGNIYAYNRLVPIFNENLSKYRTNITAYNTNVSTYNSMLDKYNNDINGRGLPPSLNVTQRQASSNF